MARLLNRGLACEPPFLVTLMSRRNAGFTLIELMIVVAIVGVLAAIAIPAFQNYVARAQAVEAVNLLGGAQSAVEDYISETGQFPTGLATLNLLGIQQSGRFVESMSIQAVNQSSGSLVAQFRTSDIASPLAGKTLLFNRTLSGSWTCETGGSNPIASNLLPNSCQ